MGDIVIDLSSYEDRFIPGSKLVLNKNVNFVFGKNGTGKSTITKVVQQSFSQSHDVYIFNGYEDIIGVNEGLDTISLGTENVKLQKEIEEKNKEIIRIEKELDMNDLEDNLAKKNKKAEDEYNIQKNKIEKFFSDSASNIKNQNEPQISNPNYYKNNFESEIKYAKLITDDEVTRLKKIIKEDKKSDLVKMVVPKFENDNILKEVNSILKKEISIKTVISELDNNKDKQNFAKEGLKVHKHENGETCAFCGNIISEERWELLKKYFNIEVGTLESDIETLLFTINTVKENVEKIESIKTDQFYEQFKPGINIYNTQIKAIKNEYRVFLNQLSNALEDKKKSLFTKNDELIINIPKDISIIHKEYESIVDENNKFSNNIENEKTLAKDTLRYHKIKITLDKFKYEVESKKLEFLNKVYDSTKNEVSKKNTELITKKNEKQKLIIQTKDEEKAAIMITDYLKITGIESFSLILNKDTEDGAKGQYKIKGHNEQERSIKELSDGEKNIIAFLYFIFKLQSIELIPNKNRIIVFDDPMTSNDDTMQYLMISEIQKLYRKITHNDKFLLLTHNIHFYLNVRPYYNKAKDNEEKDLDKKYHKKNNYFKLHSNGKLSEIIPINSSDADFKSNYHSLRDDLIYLHKNNKPISMINNCRRILETYIKFHCCDSNKFYQDSEEAKKLFDVNSHGIEDLENEPNGKTCDQIKNLLKLILEKNHAEEHFNVYFSQ